MFQMNLRGFCGKLINLLDERHLTGTEKPDWHCIIPDLLILPVKPAVRMRAKLYKKKSALELAQGIVEQNCNQCIVIQIIFNQTFFKIHKRLQNPASIKRRYKNNLCFCEYTFPK